MLKGNNGRRGGWQATRRTGVSGVFVDLYSFARWQRCADDGLVMGSPLIASADDGESQKASGPNGGKRRKYTWELNTINGTCWR